MSSLLETTSTIPHSSPSSDRPASLLVIELRLRHQFPDAGSEHIRSCVDEAAATLAGARIHQFLPILIERHAADVLRQRSS